MTYQEFIEYNKARDQGEYTHKHHIKPKCIGGTDSPDNIIVLSWLTHYYAHYLLAKENPDNPKIQADWKRKGDITCWLTKCYKLGKKGRPGPNKGNHSLNKGRHHSEETRKKMSEAHKGRPAWNKGKSMSEETRRKMSEAMKEKSKGNHNARGSHSNKGQRWKLVDGRRVYYNDSDTEENV